MEELLTVKDAAKILKMNVQTVREKAREKKLFAYKGEKLYRIPRGAIEAYLKGIPYIPPDSPGNEKAPTQ